MQAGWLAAQSRGWRDATTMLSIASFTCLPCDDNRSSIALLIVFIATMPTALDVDVVGDDAVTPPNVMKKNKKAESSEKNKITPAATAEKPKQQAQKKAQPSIMSFFKQPSRKNLFSKSDTVNTTDSSTTKKKAPIESNNDEAATPKPDTPSKPAAAAKTSSAEKLAKFSAVPTKEELREIVLGTSSTNVDAITTTDSFDLPTDDDGEAEDSLLPKVTMRNPGLKRRSEKKSPSSPPKEAETESPEKDPKEASSSAPAVEEPAKVESTNAAATAEKETAAEAPTNEPPREAVEEESAVESINEEPSKEEEVAPEEASMDDEETTHGSPDDDDEQSDDDTVDMSPLKKTLAGMKVAGEPTVDSKEAVGDAPIESVTSNGNEADKANESVDCLDLTADDTPAASPVPEKPIAEDNEPKKPAAVKKQCHSAKPSASEPTDSLAAAVGISADRQAALAKNETLRAQYHSRLDGLVQRAHEGLEEENFQLPVLTPVESLPEEGTTVSSPMEFPECAIKSLALLIQERYDITMHQYSNICIFSLLF